jgi:Phage tail lysozyme
MADNSKTVGQQFVVDILTRYRDEGVKQAREAQTKLQEVLGNTSQALNTAKKSSAAYSTGLGTLTNALKEFKKYSWEGVAVGSIIGNTFTGIANWAAQATAKVALFGEELYYMNRRLGQPGTSGLFNFAFAAQQIGLSPEQGLGAIESMGAAVRTNPGLAGLLGKFLPGFKPGNTLGAGDALGLVNRLHNQFGEKGYFISAQIAELFGFAEHEFRQMTTNLPTLNAEYAANQQRLKEFGLDTDKASKNFTEFSRALNGVIQLLDIQATKIGSWLAENIGTPLLKGVESASHKVPTWSSIIQGGLALAGGAPLSAVMGGSSVTTQGSLPSNAKEAAIQRFMAMGLSRDAAIGAATGLQGESGQSINPQSVNPTSGAYGIANWLGARKRNFAAIYGHPIEQSNAEEQWDFLSRELHGSGGDSQTAKAFQLLKNPNISASQATNIWENMVERHGNDAYTAKLALQAQNYSAFNPSGAATQNFDVDHNVTVNIQGNADMGVMKDASSILGKDRWDDQLRQAVRGATIR